MSACGTFCPPTTIPLSDRLSTSHPWGVGEMRRCLRETIEELEMTTSHSGRRPTMKGAVKTCGWI